MSKVPRPCWCWVLGPPPLPAHIPQPARVVHPGSGASTRRAGLQAPTALSGYHYPILRLSSPGGSFFSSGPHPSPAQGASVLAPARLSVPSSELSPPRHSPCLCPSRCQPCPKPISPSSCLPLTRFSSLGIEAAKASTPGSLLVLPGRTKVGLATGRRQHSQGAGCIQSADGPVTTERSASVRSAVHPGFTATGWLLLNCLSHTQDLTGCPVQRIHFPWAPCLCLIIRRSPRC